VSAVIPHATLALMPPLSIPAFLYGTAWKEDRTSSLTERALRAGFRGIDTANQRKHYFEAAAGEGLSAAYNAGIVTRAEVFLQTKFTYQRGQDHRLPYDPQAPIGAQVAQSLASSLDHLGTDYVDSYVLHGPSSPYEWAEADSEVWNAMRKERDAGRIHLIGVSNMSLGHLEQMKAIGLELPAFVQNRCFARLGWDRDIRSFCGAHQITYQGFSLLTANQEVANHAPLVDVARRLSVTLPPLIFAFARALGIVPLTGTSSENHMKEDLASAGLALPAELVKAIESIAG
jgi:diketogulonate reductase-like aldo/keto reductase